MMQVITVALGGAVGSIARYGIQRALPYSFPVGTLLVNLIGCFLIGCLWMLSVKSLSETIRLLLMTGFCGGFTTFSAFSLDAVQMLAGGRWLNFSFYVIASTAGGLLATFLAYKIFSA